jgi:predicted RecB family nuclease
VAAGDVSLLPRIGRDKRAAFAGVGVRTMKDVLSFDFSAVQIKGIGPATAELLARSARALMSGKIEVLSRPALPDAPLKIYLDFEDDPTQELVYLCGMWVEPAIRGLNYLGLFAEDDAKEAMLWADLQGFCAEIEGQDYVVFHYSGYERTKLAQLERKYGVKERNALEKFRSRMVDLRKIVEDSVVLPERSYGLKKVAPYAGHKYTNEKAGGAQSIVWFHEYQQDPNNARIIQTLQTYNQEDCQAMKAICDWLRSLR